MNTGIIAYDDNKQRLEGLQALIETIDDMKLLATFSSCLNIIENIREHRPEVILMDIDMPEINGIEAVKLVRGTFPEVKIIMQTVFDDNDKIIDAIRAGADGYILKQTPPQKLIEGIREVMSGGAPMSPTIARKVLNITAVKPTTPEKQTFDLTSRELEILQLLVKGYSYKMICDELKIAYSTVNTHITKIYKKMQVESVGGAVSAAIKSGISR